MAVMCAFPSSLLSYDRKNTYRMSDTDNTQEPSDTPQEEQVIPHAEQEEEPIPIKTNKAK